MSTTKQASRLACASHETLLRLLETHPDALFVVDDVDTIVYANARAQTMTGATREEVCGMSLWRCAPHLVSPSLYQAVKETRQTREPTAVAYASPITNSWLHVSLSPTDEGLALFVQEHQEPQHLEHAFSQHELRTLVDAIPHFVWIMRPDGAAAYANQRWCDYTGKTLEQIQGDGWLQFIHPDDRQRIQEAWQTAVRTGTPYEVEHRIQHGSTGDYRWFFAHGVPYQDAQGTILYWVGTCTDIDEQKRAEQQLRASEQNFRVLAETVPQLVWTTRAEDSLSDYFNRRFCDYTHATQEQLYGYGWSLFLHPDDAERTLAVREHALRTGIPYEVEYRLREGQTGRYRWFLARAMPVRDETGQIVKWFGTATDIDEQKRTEEALRQSQARVRALIDSNLIGITTSEWEGEEVIVEANEAFFQMTGYTQEDVDRRTLTRARITLPEDAPFFERALQELAAQGQHTPVEAELVCKDGSRLPILAGGVLFQGSPRQFVGFMLDNSARKELEQRKDAFISMASHELRNPLTVLKLQTALLHRQLARQGLQAAAPALASMETQINTITRLVEELLDVSKIQAGRLEYRQETVDLDALLREIVDTMQHTYPSHRILLRGIVQASLIGDRDRLGQVFINLLSNAIKYSPDAYTVEMELSTSPQTVTIRVRDHGLGIPQEQRDRIFERFYRASGPQHRAIPGLGIGLFIVAEIVTRHGGTISVDSEVGKGSTFTVTLPRMRDS